MEIFETLGLAALYILFYFAGAICAVFALWRSRTSQGATAWVVGLLGFPFLMVPLFLIFGRNKFFGYVRRRRELDHIAKTEMNEIRKFDNEEVEPPPHLSAFRKIAQLGAQPGFMDSNSVELLVDGEATYASMKQAIRDAKKYILFQFYIIRDDQAGSEFADLLIEKAKQGVRIYFLYDAIGTSLHRKFLKRLREGGVHVSRFSSSRFVNIRIQINFRNHRKVLVTDGNCAFIGGFNIGDDYLGKYPKMGAWRDTQVKICGPSALAAQVSFVKDWYWSEEEVLDLDWEARLVENGTKALVLHTGPADDGETALLAHITMVNAAKSRVWIANPYVVPPEGLANALGLAALRGVDVKILVPGYSDNRWVMYAMEVYAERLLPLGVKYFSYSRGFLHQKVMLIDDNIASVSSTNLDSRSLFVNFETMAVACDASFVQSVADMLEKDFANTSPLLLKDLLAKPLPRRILARAVSLLAPVL